MQSGVSKLTLKKINRSEILKILVKNGPTSRIEIAKKINLTRAAITIITNEMIDEGIIYEKGEEKTSEKNGRGRRKILLDINKNYKFTFGVVFDNKKVFLGLSNLAGEILDKIVFDIESRNIETLIEKIYNRFYEILRNSFLKPSSIVGIGICVSDDCTYLLNGKDRYARLSNLRKMFERRFDMKVVVDRTTDGLAIAQNVFDTDYEHKSSNMVFIRYGYELDAVIMLNDEIYKKPDTNVNWFPHIIVDSHGERCECGKIGCCRTRMDLKVLKSKVYDLYDKEVTPILYEKTDGVLEKVDEIAHNMGLMSVDANIKKVCEETILYMANALDNLITVLAPENIILFDVMFEKLMDINFLNNVMWREHNHMVKNKMKLSVINSSNMYLAGNGLCVRKLFIDLGGEY